MSTLFQYEDIVKEIIRIIEGAEEKKKIEGEVGGVSFSIVKDHGFIHLMFSSNIIPTSLSDIISIIRNRKITELYGGGRDWIVGYQNLEKFLIDNIENGIMSNSVQNFCTESDYHF